MTPGPTASPVITIACPACAALPDRRCAGEVPERAAAAASAR
jgi:hypothetical protein